MENPFRPSSEATPHEVIGRAGLLDEFDYGLSLGSGALGLLTIFTGARGIGKTVMLGEAHNLARQHGWAVISETATSGFMGRIGESMRRVAEGLGDGPQTRRITAIAADGFSITTQLSPERQVAWRTIAESLLRLLDERGNGLVITMDEIHVADQNELEQLAASVQHFIRDQLPIGLMLAGLPAAVSDLLREGVATFLRRADRIDLHPAGISDVKKSFTTTFGAAGFSVTPELVGRAADATGGYPILIQLVGYFLWCEAETHGGMIDDGSVERAIEAAMRQNAHMIIEPALGTAASKDMEFLRAMAEDDEASAMGDIGRRMGVKASLVCSYRTRLIAAGLVEQAGYAKVDFAIPGLREHLRQR